MLTQLLEIGGYQVAIRAEKVERIAVKEALRLDHTYLVTGGSIGLLHPFGETPFFRHGWQTWSLTAWIDPSQAFKQPLPEARWPMIDHPTLLANYPFSGSGIGALGAPDGQVLLLGALELDGFVAVNGDVLRGAYWTAAAERPHTWFLAFGAEEEVFSAYAGVLGDRLGRRGSARPPRVWCSWYSLYREIDEGLILRALNGVAGLPFDVFQIDDGWQVSLGDWQPNPKFPHGLAYLAENANENGFTAGLWLAPLAVAPGSTLFEQHPDWLVHTPDGRPLPVGHNWGDVFFGLDVTHPEAQDWLARRISEVRQWGFGYLKLDFLYAAALPGDRYQPVSGEEAFRLGLGVIRQAAGDAYLLACGSPVLASLGLADGLRIGPDVAPIWDNPDRSGELHDLTGPGTLNAIRTSVHRLWLRTLVHVDPDVAYFRSRYNLLLPHQKQILQDLVQVTGFLATSDLPEWLDPDERDALIDFLVSQPAVTRLDRYHYRLDERNADFSFLETAWPD